MSAKPRYSDPEEQYVWDERLGILIEGPRRPTPEEIALADADVQRFRKERERDKSCQKELL